MQAGKSLPVLEKAKKDLLFNALLYPNRSLPHAGFYVIIGIVVLVNIFSAIFYTRIGAWPVAFFCVFDVLIVWFAFHLSYRQGRLHEIIRLSEEGLTVSRIDPSGTEKRWQLQPFWTKVEFQRPLRHESQIQLISHGKVLIIGSFLSPAERDSLAHALSSALDKVKSGAVA